MSNIIPKKGSFEPMPTELLLPSEGTVRLPSPVNVGHFLATPDGLWAQLLLGRHNPGYDSAKDPLTVETWLGKWRGDVIACDDAVSRGIEVGADFPSFFHLTNTIARIACHPERDAAFSIKNVYHEEQLALPHQGIGRDPEQLAVIVSSMHSVLHELRQPREQ